MRSSVIRRWEPRRHERHTPKRRDCHERRERHSDGIWHWWFSRLSRIAEPLTHV